MGNLLADEIGDEIKSYREGRKCKICKCKLSIYNGNNICFTCNRKKIKYGITGNGNSYPKRKSKS